METRTWTRQVDNTTYTCSTDAALIQLDVLNAAFASELLWWAKAQQPDTLRKTVNNSLCFGVYAGDPSLPAAGKSYFEITHFTDYGSITSGKGG